MPKPSVAVVSMADPSHFRRLRPVLWGLSRRGVTVYAFTSRTLRPLVEEDGAVFVDLFERHSLEDADAESLPRACRLVSFAGHYAEDVRRDIERVKPGLVVYDTFAVIGYVVGRLLGIPYINVCAGHNVNPARVVQMLRDIPLVQISSRCHEAVRRLRERYEMPNASPFSYVDTVSPFLNLYCEPPQFLSDADRKAFAPIAFFGSLPSTGQIAHAGTRSDSYFGEGSTNLLKVYVSFGTIIWRSFTAEALRALEVLSDTFVTMPHVRAVISLGGRDIGDRATALRRSNVRVEHYVDQWKILGDADVFITHHGLNSTHEAIFHRVPMISYPFFWDQPDQATKCQEFGVAIPLSRVPRGEVTRERVIEALSELAGKRRSMRARLEVARSWEEQVMEGREAVIDRITAML